MCIRDSYRVSTVCDLRKDVKLFLFSSIGSGKPKVKKVSITLQKCIKLMLRINNSSVKTLISLAKVSWHEFCNLLLAAGPWKCQPQLAETNHQISKATDVRIQKQRQKFKWPFSRFWCKPYRTHNAKYRRCGKLDRPRDRAWILLRNEGKRSWLG